MRRFAIVAALAFVVAALALVLVSRATHRETSVDVASLRGTPLVPPKVAHDFVLTDGDGHAAHLVDAAKTTFLFFGYSHCRDTCPLALAALGKAYRTLDAASAERTGIVFVTVDPGRDTPTVVRDYARAFDPHVLALTGSRERLASVWDAYGVRIDAASHEISHGDAIYAIDRSAHVIAIYPPNAAVSDLAADMRTLAN